MKGSLIQQLVDAEKRPAEYAVALRKLYDTMLKITCNAADTRAWVLLWVPEDKRKLAAEVLPKPAPSGRERGRPTDARGNVAYDKMYMLYRDWIYERTLDPFLTKKTFAMRRLGVTAEDLAGEYGSVHHPKIDALLQELKPARMKRLDEGQRRSLEILYPLIVKHSTSSDGQ
jgi:hypothetical protein